MRIDWTYGDIQQLPTQYAGSVFNWSAIEGAAPVVITGQWELYGGIAYDRTEFKGSHGHGGIWTWAAITALPEPEPEVVAEVTGGWLRRREIESLRRLGFRVQIPRRGDVVTTIQVTRQPGAGESLALEAAALELGAETRSEAFVQILAQLKARQDLLDEELGMLITLLLLTEM